MNRINRLNIRNRRKNFCWKQRKCETLQKIHFSKHTLKNWFHQFNQVATTPKHGYFLRLVAMNNSFQQPEKSEMKRKPHISSAHITMNVKPHDYFIALQLNYERSLQYWIKLQLNKCQRSKESHGKRSRMWMYAIPMDAMIHWIKYCMDTTNNSKQQQNNMSFEKTTATLRSVVWQ